MYSNVWMRLATDRTANEVEDTLARLRALHAQIGNLYGNWRNEMSASNELRGQWNAFIQRCKLVRIILERAECCFSSVTIFRINIHFELHN